MPVAATRTPATAVPLALPDLDTQLDRLLELGYPQLAARDEAQLKDAAAALQPYAVPGDLLVVTSAWVAPEVALPLVARRGKPGRVDLTPTTSTAFAPVADLEVPGEVYLARGVETGGEYGGRRPEEVLREVSAAGRSPLTIDEGVSLLLQQPDILDERNAFSLAGSRAGDRRVPALWISYGAQRLGWCWDGAVHDWLGFASTATRHA